MQPIRSWAITIPFFAAIPLVACSAGPVSDSESIEIVSERLVGGHVADESEIPATVYVGTAVGLCTATKVGPRHFLLAAHCVNDSSGGVPSSFHTMWMTPRNDATEGRQLTVASAHIIPDWTLCPNCGCTSPWLCDMVDHPDVSLVIVEEDTPDVPEAVIDDTPVIPGQSVVMTGYGCENGVDQPSGPPRLKLQTTVAVDPLIFSPDTPGVGESYVVTEGLLVDPNSASLCPGDSGGPLYRAGSEHLRVVGINALLAYGEGGISIANWHTRVDTQSSRNVFAWLQSLGANVETGATCDNGVRDGSESDIDCGGDCAKCATAEQCSADADCMSRDCTGGLCAPTPTYGPCTDLCDGPTEVTSRYFNSGSMGTDARCFEGTFPLDSTACGGFAPNRTFTINGVQVSCNGPNITLPPARNGGYCFQASAGDYPWAWFVTW